MTIKSIIKVCIGVLFLSFFVSSCSARIGTRPSAQKTKKMPPGQAKKISGDKNAKRYAPGQN